MKPFFLAKRFVAGVQLDDAIKKSKELQEKGLAVTLDHLGEDVTDASIAVKATQQYIKILERLAKKKLKVNIAVKLSQIGLAIEEELTYNNLEAILKAAKKYKLIVEIDMEGSQYTSDTVDAYLFFIKKYPSTIIAIQAYLHQAYDDLKKIAKKKGRVRIVKGAYKEPTTIAFQNKKAVDKNYILLLEYALKHCPFTFIATHDEKIITHALEFAKKNSIKTSKCSFQMLLGIRRPLQEQLVKDGHACRIYVPYGEEWAAYFSRRVRERKENFWFAVKSIFSR